MTVSEEDIEKGLRSAARIVDRYGEVYWPLFDRLERELENRRSRASRLRAHLNSGQARRTAIKTIRPDTDGRS
ncbi:hypothetical protein [Hyphococcus sp.]|uniref:hypothetical protein n=1 Tax=Hyphococcus sp. TaxID=2038636 RepID=UPI002081BE80|nr:MAG: hypothetical protein DHS20C04_09170 [Marinicaulis sp.]